MGGEGGGGGPLLADGEKEERGGGAPWVGRKSKGVILPTRPDSDSPFELAAEARSEGSRAETPTVRGAGGGNGLGMQFR